MTQDEKDRLLGDELRKEFEKDLEGINSDNPYIQQLSVRKIQKVLRQGNPALRAVVAKYLHHPHDKVRMVVVAVLAKVPAGADRGQADRAEVRQLARDLHELVLKEESTEVLKVVHIVLARFYPSESFRLALETVTRSSSPAERQRAAEAAYYSLRKAFVPRLCRSLVSADGSTRRPEVLQVLRKTFQALGVDFGYDVAGWLRFWDGNRGRFYDQ